tara:strand:- start:407 stop:1594 length:1188 start_codon:yes stop_codon:yes gene_type:complete
MYPYSTRSSSTNFFIQDLGTAEFLGLEFIDTPDDRVVVNQNLSSKPSVLIEGTQIVLDYSDIQNIKDKQFIDLAFKAMVAGAGFTITGAVYNDPTNQYTADLSASCTLNSYSKYKILGTVSAIGSTSEINYYRPEFFDTVPQITTAAGLTYAGLTTNSLINFTTSTSTSFIGNNFQIGDYVDFATSSNAGRYTINGITIDDFSREIVSFGNDLTIVAENLKGTRVTVDHKRKTSAVSGGPYEIEQKSTVVYRVGRRVSDDGQNMVTIDGEIEKPLALSRGILYLFIIDEKNSNDFIIVNNSANQSGGAELSDPGIYSVVDNTMQKKYLFFIPNNLTPNQLYYTSAENNAASGYGGIQISGSYSYTTSGVNLNTAGGLSGSSTYSNIETGGYGNLY